MKRLLFAVIAAAMLLLCFGCSNGENAASESSEASTTEATLPIGIFHQGWDISINIPSEKYYLVCTNSMLQLAEDPIPVTVDAQCVANLVTDQYEGYVNLSCKGIDLPEMNSFAGSLREDGFSLAANYFYMDEDKGVMPGTIHYLIMGTQDVEEKGVLIQILCTDNSLLRYVVKADRADTAYDTFYALWMDLYGQSQ